MKSRNAPPTFATGTVGPVSLKNQSASPCGTIAPSIALAAGFAGWPIAGWDITGGGSLGAR